MATITTLTGWESGSFYIENGTDVASNKQVRTTCLIRGGSILTFNIEVNGGVAQYALGYFDGNDNYLGWSDFQSNGTNLYIPDNASWSKIAVKYSDNRVMSPSDITRSEYVYDPWYVSEGRLKHDDFADLIEPLLSPPYPPEIWTVSNDRLTQGALIDLPKTGAFSDCIKLRTVIFPSTVTYIGPYAFAGTALREVTIPEGCQYSSTSFPNGCIVHTE